VSEWHIDESLFDSPTRGIMEASIRRRQDEWLRQLRKAEREMGCPIEVVRTEWDGLTMTTWYRAASKSPKEESEERVCPTCGEEVQEDGNCPVSAEPCYYCPDDGTCRTCGRGSCDQSC
jgi:hypothetical protein